MARRNGAEIQVENLRDLQRQLRSIDRDLGKELRKANKSAAEIVAEQAVKEAPRRSGRLAKSVGALVGQRDAKVKAGSAARVPYAGPIHFGWAARGIKPNPFLYRALSKTSEQAKEVYRTKIDALARRAETTRRRT